MIGVSGEKKIDDFFLKDYVALLIINQVFVMLT